MVNFGGICVRSRRMPVLPRIASEKKKVNGESLVGKNMKVIEHPL